MTEMNPVSEKSVRKIRHRGRIPQIPIYLGKLFRGFLYENDWKFLPGAAIIAALVAMVVRRDYFPSTEGYIMSMEGTLKGAFALTCVAIWNGCFNSIQVICRERAIIKREHRSGMHISSYVIAHMIYQAFLCLLQSVLTVAVCRMMGVDFPRGEGMFTDYFFADMVITLFLISYASDMISLLVSALCHSTTTAMTIMPFLLIFQLVFSGGIFKLPEWANNFSYVTISNYGMKCVASLSDYNSQPLVTAWDTLVKTKDEKIDTTVTPERILSIFENSSDPQIASLRDKKVLDAMPLNAELKQDIAGLFDGTDITLGELVDYIASLPVINNYKDYPIPIDTTYSTVFESIGALLDDNMLGVDASNMTGMEKLKEFVMKKTAAASQIPAYDHDITLVLTYWAMLCAFILIFSVLTVVVLEFIDKDKR